MWRYKLWLFDPFPRLDILVPIKPYFAPIIFDETYNYFYEPERENTFPKSTAAGGGGKKKVFFFNHFYTYYRLHHDQLGGAWCPKSAIKKGIKEWLQISLQQVHIITGLVTQVRTSWWKLVIFKGRILGVLKLVYFQNWFQDAHNQRRRRYDLGPLANGSAIHFCGNHNFRLRFHTTSRRVVFTFCCSHSGFLSVRVYLQVRLG